MNIGIIGAGNIGSVLASRLFALGHQVYISNSRGPGSLEGKFDGQSGINAVDVHQAARKGDVVIVTIPEKNIVDLPQDLFKGVPDEVVVIDTCNYYPHLRDGEIPELAGDICDSEWVQQKLGRPVVKVFNSITFMSLRDAGKPQGEPGRIALPVSGDNLQAKETVFKLVDALGFDPYDMGGLERSWRQQPGTPIYCRDLDLQSLKAEIAEMGDEWSGETRKTIEEARHAQEVEILKMYQQ